MEVEEEWHPLQKRHAGPIAEATRWLPTSWQAERLLERVICWLIQHDATPSRMALNALTICGIMCTNSAVILIPSTNDVPINDKLTDLYWRKLQ